MKKALIFKSIFIIVVAISFTTCLQAQELPIVQNNTIQFIGGKTLLTEDNASYFIYAAQKRLIYITRDRRPPHAIEYVVYFFDYYGNELSHTNTNEKLSGEFDFIYFEKKDRLLVAQRTVFSRARTSYLFDLNGRLIKEFSHDSQPRLIEVTGDENYFYYITGFLRFKREDEESFYPDDPSYKYVPYHHVMVFDTLTGKFEKQYSVDGTDLDMVINNKIYSITLPKPEMWP